MEVQRDFEDMLALLEKHRVRYLIVGGIAFIFHAKPRFTKDLDIWLDPTEENVLKANAALSEFGSPFLLTIGNEDEILQIGVAPDRIDLIRATADMEFGPCWEKRIRSSYGQVEVNWIDIDNLIEIKSRIDDPRHQSDVRVLKRVKDRAEKIR